MAQLFSNNVRSALAGAITDIATTINVTTGTGARFPSPAGGDFFLATIVGLDANGNENAWEIVKCTGRAADALTVVRAQEGTTAIAWSSGATIEMRLTAASADHGAYTHAANAKATPVDADEVGLVDSADSNKIKRLSWANIKATLKSYLDTLYVPLTRTINGFALSSDVTISTITGNAGTATALATGRTIDGQTFDGTANITVIAPGTHVAVSKTTPVDADELPLVDSAATFGLKKISWANIKAAVWAALGPLIAGGAAKTTLADADSMALADSAASSASKQITWANVKTAIWSALGALIAGGTAKATPADADTLALADSAASNATKKLAWSDLKAAIGTYIGSLAQTLTNKTMGAFTIAGNVTGGDFLLTRQMIRDQGIVYYDSGATSALDYVNGSHQRWAPAAASNPTLTISNWPPSGNLGELLIEGMNLNAAGNIVWPTINWVKSDGSFTTTFSSNGVTLQSSGTDWVVLWTRDAGATIYGKVIR